MIFSVHSLHLFWTKNGQMQPLRVRLSRRTPAGKEREFTAAIGLGGGGASAQFNFGAVSSFLFNWICRLPRSPGAPVRISILKPFATTV
jgi:hypothetical protein